MDTHCAWRVLVTAALLGAPSALMGNGMRLVSQDAFAAARGEAFVATAELSREIENKTVLTVVSKPVGRTTVIMGKYLGVSVTPGAIALTRTLESANSTANV